MKLQNTALRSIETKRWTATGIETWPNGMGINFRMRSSRFEILFDDQLKRIEIVRHNADDQPTHIYKLHGYSSAPSTHEGLIELAALLWIDRRSDFSAM